MARATYAELVEKGCTCGGHDLARCPLHPEPGDNRGLRAFFEAGMPQAFPTEASCAICGADSLIYPSVELDRGEVPAGEAPGPTLVCPRCSSPASERKLRSEAEAFGHKLNARAVFGSAAVAA